MGDHGVVAALAEASVIATIWACLIVGPLAALFALWRVRRGVAAAGALGFLARWLGGAAVIAAFAYAAMWATAPGLKVMTASSPRSPATSARTRGSRPGFPS